MYVRPMRARTSLAKALKVSFTGGSVMGLGVAGLAVLGLGGLFIILKQFLHPAQMPIRSIWLQNH